MKSECLNIRCDFNLSHLCSRKFERYEVIQEFKLLPPNADNFPMDPSSLHGNHINLYFSVGRNSRCRKGGSGRFFGEIMGINLVKG